MPRRRRRLGGLHVAAHDRGARRRRAHVRGPRDRPGRQRRPDAGVAHASRSTPPRRRRRSTRGPAGPTQRHDADASRSRADEAGSTFECRVDGGAWAPARRRSTTAALADGAHTLRGPRHRRGRQHRRRPRPARTFTVDTAAPQTDDRQRPVRPDQRRHADLRASPPTSRARRSSAASTAAPGPPARSPHTTARARPTARTRFEVRATDAAGNVDPTPASRAPSRSTRPPPHDDDRQPARPARRNDTTPTFDVLRRRGRRDLRVPRRRRRASRPARSPHTTAALGRRRAHASRSAPPTPPATPTRRRPAARFTVDTDARRRRRSTAGPTGPTNDTTPTFELLRRRGRLDASSAASTAARWAPARRRTRPPALADGAHTLRGPRDRRRPATPTRRPRRARSRSTPAAPADDDRQRPGRARRNDTTPTFAFSADEAGATLRVPRRRRRLAPPARRPHTTAALGRRRAHASRSAPPTPPATPTPRRPARTLHGRHGAARRRRSTAGPAGRDRTTRRRPSSFSADEAGSTLRVPRRRRRLDGAARRRSTTAALADGAHTLRGPRHRRRPATPTPTPGSAHASRSTPTAPRDDDRQRARPARRNDTTPSFDVLRRRGRRDLRVPRRRRRLRGLHDRRTRPPALADGAHTLRGARDRRRPATPTPTPATAHVHGRHRPRRRRRSTAARPARRTTPTPDASRSPPTRPARRFECRVDGGACAPCTLAAHDRRAGRRRAHASRSAPPTPAGNTDADPGDAAAFTVDTAAPRDDDRQRARPGPTTDTHADASRSPPTRPASTLRVPRRRRRVRALHARRTRPRALADGAHTLRGPRHRRRPATPTPTPGQPHVHGRHHGAADDDRLPARPARPTTRRRRFAFSADEAGSTFECRVDGGALGALHLAAHDRRAGRRRAHVRGPRDRRRRQRRRRRPATRTLHGRHRARRRHDDRQRARRARPTTPRRRFAFSSDEPGSTFECRVDGGALAPCTSPHTTAALADGAHTFEVRATDAGRQRRRRRPRAARFTSTPPRRETTIDAGPRRRTTSDTTPTFALLRRRGRLDLRVPRRRRRLVAAAPRRTRRPRSADGAHTFEVRATDAAGNVDADAGEPQRSRSTPRAAAETTITAGPAGPTTRHARRPSRSPPTSRARRSSAASTAAAWAPCTSPHTTAALTDGAHTLRGPRHRRGRQRRRDARPSRTFTVDTARAAETTITSGPPRPDERHHADASTFTADEPGATFECRVDGGALRPCTSPHTTAAADRRRRTRFEVRAIDAAGNTDPTPASAQLHASTPPRPRRRSTAGPAAARRPTRRRRFDFSASETGVDLRVPRRRRPPSPAAPRRTRPPRSTTARTPSRSAPPTRPATSTPPPPAARSRSTRSHPTRRRRDHDHRRPTGPTSDTTPDLRRSPPSEPGSTLRVPRRRRPPSPPARRRTRPRRSADGTHTFEVRAIDAAGNTDATPRQPHLHGRHRRARHDDRPPAPPASTTDTTPTFEFTADEPGASFECRVDGGAFAPCTSPHTTAALGRRHAHLRGARDRRGRQHRPDARPAAPSPSTPRAPADDDRLPARRGPTDRRARPTFEFSADEPGSTLRVPRRRRRLRAPARRRRPPPRSRDGAHTFEVRATDAAGNTDATPASRAASPSTPHAPRDDDRQRPGRPDERHDADVRLLRRARPARPSSAASTAAPGRRCTSPHTTAALADGAHSFEVRATDAAGNVDPTPAARTFTVDTAAPETTITAGPGAETTT